MGEALSCSLPNFPIRYWPVDGKSVYWPQHFFMPQIIIKPITVFDNGKGSPTIGLVACTHGDEVIGQKSLAILRDVPVARGRLMGIVAHPRAVAEKKRFFKTDLNRSFPGKRHGGEEIELARHVLQSLKECNTVVDIHGTNSNIDSLAIVTKWDKKTKNLLAMLPIKKIMYSPARAFAGGALIRHVAATSVAIEYGPDKRGLRFKIAVRNIKSLLANLEMISGKKIRYSRKVVFSVTGTYPVPKGFRQAVGLKEFRYIKKGQYIGHVRTRKFFATSGFYPIFLGKGHYSGTLALMAKCREIVL